MLQVEATQDRQRKDTEEGRVAWHEARARRRSVGGCQRPHLHLHLARSRGVAFISYVRVGSARQKMPSRKRETHSGSTQCQRVSRQGASK